MKKNILFCFLTFLIGVGGFNYSALAFSASYVQSISRDGTELASFSVVLEDKNMRAETEMGGSPSILLKNSEGTFSYRPSQNIAYKVPDTSSPQITEDLPHYVEFLTKNAGKKIGSEKLGEYDCDVYEFVEPISKNPAKSWVWKSNSFPVKIEINGSEGVTEILFSEIKIGIKPEANIFSLPAEVKVYDLQKLAAAGTPANEAAS